MTKKIKPPKPTLHETLWSRLLAALERVKRQNANFKKRKEHGHG